MALNNGTGTAFFEFDTNANAVAANITAAMQRINAAMSRPVSSGQLAADTQGLSQMFTRMQGDLTRATGDVKALLDPRRWAGGVIDPVQFQSEFQKIVRRGVSGIPQVMADELAKAPQAVATRAPLQAIAAEQGQAYVQTLLDAVRNNRGLAQGALSGVRFDQRPYRTDLMDLALNPVAYGSETSRMAELTNRVRAEGLVRQDPLGLAPQQQALEAQLGMSKLMSQVRAEMVQLGPEGGVSILPSKAAPELSELIRLERDAIATGQRLTRTREQEARATAELAAAQAALSSAHFKAGSRIVDPATGAVSRLTPTGQTAETNPWRVDDAVGQFRQFQQDQANGQKLLANWADMVPVGQYQVLNGEVFKLNEAGARQITSQTIVNQQLEKAHAIKAKDLETEQRRAQLQARHDLNNDGSILTGAMNRLHRGDQDTMNSLGGQMMSAAMFSLAYGSLFALQAVLRDTMNEFLDYQDSVTDLEVATRSADVVTGEWVNSLSQLSRLSGSNMGAALDTAARGIRAFTSEGDSAAQIEAVGTATEEAATKLALIASKDLKDATGDVVAVGSAFNLEPDQLMQVVDAVANAKRSLGGDPAQIAQGLSLIAGSAQEAGFTLNEAASVISLVQARTDQSGQAIATRLSRIFQIVTGSTGKSLARELGVNPDMTVKDQISAFADIYSAEGTSEAVKDRITSGLGGTANLREILPLLKDNERLQKAYREALRNSGQGTDEFNRKSDNLVGTLKKIKGDLSNLQVDLARAGFFDAVGGAISVLEPALHGIDLLVKAYDQLTDKIPYLQTTLGILIDIALVSKAIALVQAKSGLFAGAKAAVGGAAAGAAGGAAGSLGAAGAGAAGGAAANASMKTGFLTLGRFLMNPVTILAGAAIGMVAIGAKLYEERAEYRGMIDRASMAQNAFGRVDGTSESLRAAARDLKSVAGGMKKDDIAGRYDADRDRIVDEIQDRARGLNLLAQRAAQEERLAAATQQLTVFGTGAIETVTQLADGLDILAASGSTDLTKLREVRRALMTPPPQAGELWGPEVLKGQITSVMMDTLTQSIPEGTVAYLSDDPARRPSPESVRKFPETALEMGMATTDRERVALAIEMGPEEVDIVSAAIDEQIKALGLEGKKTITVEQKEALLKAALEAVPMEDIALGGQEVIDQWFKISLRALKNKPGVGAGSAPQNLLNARRLSPDNIDTLLNPSDDPNNPWIGLPTLFDQGLASIPANDDGTMLEAELGANLSLLQSMKDRSTGDHEGLELLIANVESQYREVAVANAEDLRLAAESRAKSNKQLRAIRLRFAKISFDKAGDDVNEIEALMESMDRQTIEAIIDYVTSARNIARRAYNHARSLIEISAQILRMTPEGPLMHGGNIVADPEDSEGKKTELDTLNDQLHALKNVYTNDATITEDKAEVSSSGSSAEKDRLTAAQRAALLQQANVDPDNSVGTAAAALNVAEANLAAAKHGSEEWIQALGAVNQARDAYSKAVAGHAGAVASAEAARLGGGLAGAQAALTAASAQLGATAKGTTAYYQALAGFYQAQWSMREAVLAYQGNLDLLDGDMTDPVEQARDALRAARRKLATDTRAGAGKDVLAEDQVAVEQSETALEKAKWDQKLSDMQVAEQLGNISYTQYVGYLQRESDRMHKMRNKTRQQIDHMNQIDLALKEAAKTLQGQFNIGDINTNGLVYQARRYAAERRAERSAASIEANTTVMQDVRIQIDGADIGKVRQIIDDYVGKAGRVRTTQARRR